MAADLAPRTEQIECVCGLADVLSYYASSNANAMDVCAAPNGADAMDARVQMPGGPMDAMGECYGRRYSSYGRYGSSQVRAAIEGPTARHLRAMCAVRRQSVEASLGEI